MHNTDIRAEAKKNGVFLYDIAEKLGISEPTMTRRMRRELSEPQKAEMRNIIAEISKARAIPSTK